MQDGAVPPGIQHEFELWRQPSKKAQPASHARQQARQSSMLLSSCTKGLGNSGTKSGPRSQWQTSWCRQRRSVLVSTAPDTCAPSFRGPSTRKGRRGLEKKPLDHRARRPRHGDQVADGPILGVHSWGRSAHWRRTKSEHSSVQSQSEVSKRFLSWLALRYELTYPTALNHLTEYF